MPFPQKNEARSSFITRAIHTFLSEGKTQKQAIGAAYGFWREYGNGGKKKKKQGKLF